MTDELLQLAREGVGLLRELVRLQSQGRVPSKVDENAVRQAVGTLRRFAEGQVKLGNLTPMHRNRLVEFVQGQHPELEGNAWFGPAMKLLVGEGVFEDAGRAKGSGLYRPTPGQREVPSSTPRVPDDIEGTSTNLKVSQVPSLDLEGASKVASKAHLQPYEHWKEILEVREKDIDRDSHLPRSRALVANQLAALAKHYDPKVRSDDGSWTIIQKAANLVTEQLSFHEKQQRANFQ